MKPQARFLNAFVDLKQMPSDLPQACVLGRSNSGKSTLLSSLMQNPRIVKTSRKPGSTRTVNVYDWAGLHLVDLPGYGYASVSHKQRDQLSQLLAEYLGGADSLRLGLLTMDIRREPREEEDYLAKLFVERGLPLHLVLTKCDKLNQKETAAAAKKANRWKDSYAQVHTVSATRGKNIDKIIELVSGLARAGS